MNRDNGAMIAVAATAAIAAVAALRRKGSSNEEQLEISEPLHVAARGPERALQAMGQEKMPLKKWQELMASRGVTAEQMALRGFDELAQTTQRQGKKSLTRAEVLDWFQKNPLRLKEVWRGLPPESSISGEERDQLERRKRLQSKIRSALSGLATGPEIDTAIGGGMMEFPTAMLFAGPAVNGPEIIAQNGENTIAYSQDTNQQGKWLTYFNGQAYPVSVPTRVGDIKIVKGKPVWAAVSWRCLVVNGEEHRIEGQIEPIEIPNSNGRTADQFFTSSIAVSPDGKLVAIGTNLAKILFWDVAKKQVVKEYKNDSIGFNITALAWCDKGLFYADLLGRIRLLSVGRGIKELATIREGLYPYLDMKMGMVRQDEKYDAYDADTGAICSMRLSPDGKTLAAVSEPDGVVLYDTDTLKRLAFGGRGMGFKDGSWLGRDDFFMAIGDGPKEVAEIGTDGSYADAYSGRLESGRGLALGPNKEILAAVDGKAIKLIRVEVGTQLYRDIKEYLSIPHKESDAKWSSYVAGQPDAYREMLLQYKPEAIIQKPVAHWPEHNAFGWARMTWRKPGRGDGHALFIDEIQSDWAQRARKNPNEYAKFPMPNDWWAAIFKHALVEAIRTGARSIALTDAETIGNKVNNPSWEKQLAPFYDVQIANWLKKFGQSLGIEIKKVSIQGLPKDSYWGFDLTPENVGKIRRANLSLFGRV
jgi:WD40 repeat protein